MLYLLATPIGNLSDLSLRALDTLRSCDYILCEDTRHSSHLLHHYQIQKQLKSYHRFNEKKQLDLIVNDLKNGLNLCLISDAGTPILCDPGHLLIKRCREEKIEVTAIGGPCAALQALILSGFDPIPFQFVGFLPKRGKERGQLLKKVLLYEGATVAYETPHRLQETLQMLASFAPHRSLCILRELTKLHEECLQGTAPQLEHHFQHIPPRGELVLVIDRSVEEVNWSHLSLQEHVLTFQREWGLPMNEAIKAVAQIRSLPKRIVYQEIHKISNL